MECWCARKLHLYGGGRLAPASECRREEATAVMRSENKAVGSFTYSSALNQVNKAHRGERQRYRQRDRETDRLRDMQTERQTYIETGRQTDRETDRQRDRQTES